MSAPTTRFKQLLLDALSTPQRKRFPSSSEAHRARFAMYDALRRMRKQVPPDPYGELKDSLEFLIIPSADASAELVIQPKSTRLVGCLDDWTGANASSPPPPADITTLQQQLHHEAAATQDLDPTNPEDQLIIQQANITAWIDSIAHHLTSDQFQQVTRLRRQAGPAATLEDIRALLSSHGIHCI